MCRWEQYMMSTVYSACLTAPNTSIQSHLPVMTWDPPGLGDDRVAVPEVVASKEIREETIFNSHLVHPERITEFTIPTL